MNKTKDVSNWYHCQSLGSVTVTLADKCNAGVTTVAQSSFAIHWVCLEHEQNQGCYQLVPLSVISSKHNTCNSKPKQSQTKGIWQFWKTNDIKTNQIFVFLYTLQPFIPGIKSILFPLSFHVQTIGLQQFSSISCFMWEVRHWCSP